MCWVRAARSPSWCRWSGQLGRRGWSKIRPIHTSKHISGVNPNLYCVSIECEGVWSETKGALTDKQLAAAAELTRYIVAEVKRIYKVDIPIDREYMIGHCEINPVTRPHCPGEAFPYDALIAAAKEGMEIPVGSQKLPYTVQCGAFGGRRQRSQAVCKVG